MKAKSLLLLLLAVASSAVAQPKWYDVAPKESAMTYKLIHPLHEIEATSYEVVYRVNMDATKHSISNVTVAADVASYSSGNSSRDSHAMEVIDAISFPDVSFTSTNVTQNGDKLLLAGRLTFHGVTKDITVAGDLSWTPDKMYVAGNFNISLTAFSIDRPSLMLVPVEDTLRFTYHAAFKIK